GHGKYVRGTTPKNAMFSVAGNCLRSVLLKVALARCTQVDWRQLAPATNRGRKIPASNWRSAADLNRLVPITFPVWNKRAPRDQSPRIRFEEIRTDLYRRRRLDLCALARRLLP